MSERDRAAFWVLHDRIAPIGSERLDRLATLLATVIARSAGNDHFRPADAQRFIDPHAEDAGQTVEAMQGTMRTAARK